MQMTMGRCLVGCVKRHQRAFDFMFPGFGSVDLLPDAVRAVLPFKMGVRCFAIILGPSVVPPSGARRSHCCVTVFICCCLLTACLYTSEELLFW